MRHPHSERKKQRKPQASPPTHPAADTILCWYHHRWLTSFPEGQSLYGDTLRISRRLMQAQGLEPYNHVLYSLDGDNFANCVSMLGANCAVYDVTIAYPELRGNRLQLRPSLMRLLRGRFPAAVHIHVSRHERKELPSDADKLKQW